MIDEEKLKKIVETFAAYNVDIKTDGFQITSIDGNSVVLDAQSYMPDHLVEVINKVVTQHIIKKVWGFF